MMKQKLPKNWIVLNSNTHRDRVYYFNTKTNESSWTEPTADQSEQAKKKPALPSKKRKKSIEESNVSPDEPVSPGGNVSKEKYERKKLTAKRFSQHVPEKVSPKKETPQMQALREKMLKRKEKNSLGKAQNPRQSIDIENSLCTASDKEGSLMFTPKNVTSTKEIYTPQMQAVLQKMQAKASKSSSKTKKVEESRDATQRDKREDLIEPRKLRNRDSIDKTTTKKRSDGSVSVELTPLKKNRKSLKKNLGKERMEKLRQSFRSEDNFDSSTQPACTSQSLSSLNSQKKIPSIYKNVEVRLTRLKVRLSKDKHSINKSPGSEQFEKADKLPVESVTTVKDLISRSNDTLLCEEMDWEPMQDEKITFEVQAVRTQLCTEKNTDTVCSVPSNNLGCPIMSEQQEKKQLYIVVDTNVFLTNIEAIELARNATFKTYDQPIIVIPWTVIRELDYIKDNHAKTKSTTLSNKARRAVNYINKLFSCKHPRVMGQTPEDVAKNKEKFSTDCPDDEILQMCLQVRDLDKFVVLLSYDKNLCNKAMIYDIVTLGRNDPLEKIDYLSASNSINDLSRSFQEKDSERLSLEPISILSQESRISNEILGDAKGIIRDFLTMIVSREMHALYGESWEKYVIIKPPWTVVTVLQCAIKHWIAAVSESFIRKAEILLRELLQIFKDSSGEITLKEVGYILDKCNDLIQMSIVDKCADLIVQASQKIDELRQKCHNCQCQMNEQKLRDAIGVEGNISEQERRAQKAFQYFEAAYVFARDMCGLAAESVRMPCSFHYNIPHPLPSLDYIKQIQPELAANVNRLLHTLSAIIEQIDDACIDHRTLNSLHQSLVTFLPESAPAALKFVNDELVPLDVYCCVKQKEDVLKTGLRQLQDLSTHFCRLASYRCT